MREIVNAKIRSVTLGYEDHGILTAVLHLDFGGSGQGFGGYQLDSGLSPHPFKATAACGLFIAGVLKTLEIDSWEKLPGQIVRVDGEGHRLMRIGHALKNQWFDPSAELQKLGD